MNPVPNTIFVLGAGFSVAQGYPLARDMKDEVICFMNREQHSSYWPYMQPWDAGYEEGRFFAGLEAIDENKELQFEELLLKLAERLKCRSEDPYFATNEVLRIGAARLLWEVHKSCETVIPAYKNFAGQLRKEWQRKGIISFNWDLQAERLLHELKVPWHYDLTAQRGLPVIKPHGSLNWSGYLRENLTSDYPFWLPIRPDSKLSFDCKNPLANPDENGIHRNLQYMIFPGDPDFPESDQDMKLLWKDAACLMDRAEEVVFIGYSFPCYDQHSREFFKDGVRGKKIVVVNPSPDHLQGSKSVLGAEAAEIELRQETFRECPYAQPTTDT